jgi:hypothetical protein
MTEVLYAVEGGTDVPYAEKLITLFGRKPRLIAASGGAAAIDEKLQRWSRPSNHTAMLVLRDWDDADNSSCPAALRSKLTGVSCPENVALRIVVRSIETWLMADRQAAIKFFRTSEIPSDPEDLRRPKIALVNACRRSSSASIRRGMVPLTGSGSPVGVDFARLVIEFGVLHWDPLRARQNAPSLDRTLVRLGQLTSHQIW